MGREQVKGDIQMGITLSKMAENMAGNGEIKRMCQGRSSDGRNLVKMAENTVQNGWIE